MLKTLGLVYSVVCCFMLHAVETKTLIIIGDSITAGAGVSRAEAYPARVQRKITCEGLEWSIVTDGVNGSVSASAAARVKAALVNKPNLIVLALGANDGLRRVPLATVEENLGRALALATGAGVKTLLLGLKVPDGYSPVFAAEVEALFTRLAQRFGVFLLPSMLEGVANVAALNQADGVHPNAAGHAVIADHVFAALRPLL